jgi:retron-type reverse transcriptase
MQNAETVLGVLRERGRRGLPCEQLYRQLFNPQLYLLAYGRIYSNQGAMTPGATPETVDGMSLDKIGRIIDAMRHERYRFHPARRIYIPKKNGKLRPLGLPTWSDKLVGEVIRLLLEAFYEPQFSDRSHGYRPGRGCHTALREIAHTWTGTAWFIEADISDCFGSLDHQVMLSTLAEKIHDNRFLRLLRNMLQAGYLEDWVYHVTLSGTPQGGVASLFCPTSICTNWTASSKQYSSRSITEAHAERATLLTWSWLRHWHEPADAATARKHDSSVSGCAAFPAQIPTI